MITKKDLVKAISKRIQGFTQADISIVVDELFETILDTLKDGEEIYLYGFGKYSVTDCKEVVRKAPNGEPVTIPAHRKPKFKFFESAKADF